MRSDRNRKNTYIFLSVLSVCVLWLSVLTAQAAERSGSLKDFSESLAFCLMHPFQISFTSYTLKSIGIALLVYVFILLIYFSSRKNYRKGIEYGSAKWGDVKRISKAMGSREKGKSLILSQNMRLGRADRDIKRHRRNLNVLVNGGSGAGKTLSYVTPNIIETACSCSEKSNDSEDAVSLIILDPKGETLFRCGGFLKKCGYKVKVLDLLSMECSFAYNPFAYVREDHKDEDVQTMVSNIFSAANPKRKGSQDPFWDLSAMMMLKAIILYVYETCSESERNFASVNLMLRYAVSGSDSKSKTKSAVDVLFEDLKKSGIGRTALSYYELYSGAADDTMKSIRITLVSKLEKFIIPALETLTMKDELDIRSLGLEKTALFAVTPDNDTSYNFLVSILYSQIFQQLYKMADEEYHGRLPVSVHFIMDEFANVALPSDFQQILSTMRSRGISASIIIQNIAQLKALFEKEWESIIGNCDSFVYLGGNEQSTHEYVSKLLGKETIDTDDYSRSKGRSGSFSKSSKQLGRELMTPAEVRLLDNRDCLVFIRGEYPVRDRKYDIFKDSRIKYTALGGGEPYIRRKRLYTENDLSVGKAKEYKKEEMEKILKEEGAVKMHPLFK